MNQIAIICSDPIVEKLLQYITAELPEPSEQVVLLDASQMERIPEFSGAKVILFTASADPVYLTAAREAGADGFWYLQPFVQELANVLEGGSAFPEKPPSVPLGNSLSGILTKRELEVLRELVKGKSDAQIGETLNMAIPTVKHHIQQLFFKTGLSNRTQMAVAAVVSGVIASQK